MIVVIDAWSVVSASLKDDKYLALATDVIISGDERQLLPMTPWRGIPILRAAEFVAWEAV